MKQTVLITGASGGLGLALAMQFAQHGYDLILTARSADKLQQAQNAIRTAYDVAVTVIPLDLGAPDGAAALMDAVRTQDLTVDILVNNAGLGDFGAFADSELSRQQAMIALNVSALTELTHHVLPMMREKGHGKILNVASIAAFQQGPYMSVYYATKAYVLSFSQALSRELKGSGITVTALCPGPIATGFEETAQLGKSKLFRSMPVSTAENVARYGYKATMKGKQVAIHTARNRFLININRIVPRRMAGDIICHIQGEIK